jgi:cardiolipin synthase A/B
MKPKFSEHATATRAEFFLEGTRYYNSYVELIDQAKKTIHLQTYIFEMDVFGQRVHQALMRAVQRGVQVYLLFDSVGSKEFSRKDYHALVESGVQARKFNGLNVKWLYQWGRRLHHKILLTDHQHALIGGINVTTSGYGHEGPTQQLDFAVLLEGPVVNELVRYCEFVFKKAGGIIAKNDSDSHASVLIPNEPTYDVRISINDWVYRRWQITRQYSSWTKKAKKEITIINSYFFPRRRFMRKLVEAAQRGVRVRLILPKLSDWPSYILASQFLYSYFLKRGVEIYEWKKSILHGKLATIDGTFATMGSYNLNYTSYQQNLEMNVDFYSEEFTGHLNEVIDELISVGCEKINPDEFIQKAGLKVRFLRFFYYILLSAIANFSVILTYQEEGNGNRRSKYINMISIIAAVVCLILGIIGAILPVMPGFPFFVISFLLVYRQLIFRKNDLE